MNVVKCVSTSSSIFFQYTSVARSKTPASPTSFPRTPQFDLPFHSPNIAILNHHINFNQELTAAHGIRRITGTVAPVIKSHPINMRYRAH